MADSKEEAPKMDRFAAAKEKAEMLLPQLERKMIFAAHKANAVDFVPYSTKNGEWQQTNISWWTNGFWGALMWQMYLMTGNDSFKASAIRNEEMMDKALYNFENLDHDVGFMWLIQSGIHYTLDADEDSRKRLVLCGDLLASRYNPNGFIKAWNGSERNGVVIIDCMMNLSLLYWTFRETGDPRYKLIAMRHADTAMKYFVRENGSCNHIVTFNPETGEYIDNPAGQGCASGSSWSRGQAWGLYGFAISYLQTGKEEYLHTAEKIADYFILCAEKTGWMPLCDFCQKENDLFDDCAGAIAASGLIEISRITGNTKYFDAGVNIVNALLENHSDLTLDTPAILQKCTSAYSDEKGRHITMVYADYFLVEAIAKLAGKDKIFFWAPDKAQIRRNDEL